MGYKLRREIRDALPPGVLTAAERLLVLELADACGDDTREGWPGAAKLAALTDLSERSIQETLARIGRKWVELRVQLGEKDGRPIYAYTGKRTTFRFPVLPRQGATDPGSVGATDPGASEPTGATDPEGRCDESVPEVRQIRGPSSSRTSFKSNTSSLSAPAVEALAPDVRAPQPEREIVDASQKPNKEDPISFMLLAAGCPADRTGDIRAWIADNNSIGGPGWWFTVHRNGHLALHVAEGLKALDDRPAVGKPAWCGDCDERTRQRTTEWMGSTSIARCPDCHPLTASDGRQRSSARPVDGERVADPIPLHRKYNGRENGHKTFQNPPIEAYYGAL